MSALSQDQRRPAPACSRAPSIYALLILFAVYYLLPLYVMLVNSLKPLDEIRQGNMLALPRPWTIEPWLSAWSTAQIGVQPTGLKPYFLNSILMVVPAVAHLDDARRAQRLRADQMALPRRQHRLRPDAARLLHPVPDRAHPVGAHPRPARPRRHGQRAGADPRRLRPRLHDAVLPQLLRGLSDRAGARGADRRRQLLPDLPAHPAAVVGADHRRHRHLAVHQHLERLPVRRRPSPSSTRSR